MSDVTKTERPNIFINEHEMYVLMRAYKTPKTTRDTFRVLFESAALRDDLLVTIESSDENMRKWSDAIGIRASAVEKRIEKLLECGMLAHEVRESAVIDGSYVVPTRLYSFMKTYTHDHGDDVLVVRESLSEGWADCRFPKFVNAMSWYEAFDERTRRVFTYAMAHVTDSKFGEFVVTNDSFLEDASSKCLLTTGQVEGALDVMESQELLLKTRKDVFMLNPERLSIGVPWNSIVAIDAEFKFNKLGWGASFSYVRDASQTDQKCPSDA